VIAYTTQSTTVLKLDRIGVFSNNCEESKMQRCRHLLQRTLVSHSLSLRQHSCPRASSSYLSPGTSLDSTCWPAGSRSGLLSAIFPRSNDQQQMRHFETGNSELHKEDETQDVTIATIAEDKIENIEDSNVTSALEDSPAETSRDIHELKRPQTITGNEGDEEQSIRNDARRSGKSGRRQPKRGGRPPPTEWVTINSTPKFAVLEDVLQGVEEVLATNEATIDRALQRDARQHAKNLSRNHQNRGPPDPDAKNSDTPDSVTGTTKDTTHAEFPQSIQEIQELHNLPSHMVTEARMILSRMKRPAGWFVRFPHPTIAREFARLSRYGANYHKRSNQHDKQPPRSPMRVGWKEATVALAVDPQQSNSAFKESVENMQLDDSVVRMERVHYSVPPSTLRSFFKYHQLADERFGICAIQKVVEGVGNRYRAHGRNRQPEYRQAPRVPSDESMLTVDSEFSTYLVRFDDPSWARAAVREKQGIPLHGQRLFLMQYPKQLL
jgi:hypothetical protein